MDRISLTTQESLEILPKGSPSKMKELQVAIPLVLLRALVKHEKKKVQILRGEALRATTRVILRRKLGMTSQELTEASKEMHLKTLKAAKAEATMKNHELTATKATRWLAASRTLRAKGL